MKGDTMKEIGCISKGVVDKLKKSLSDIKKIELKTNDVYIVDKHLIRLSAPPKTSRPGRLIKVSKNSYESTNEKERVLA